MKTAQRFFTPSLQYKWLLLLLSPLVISIGCNQKEMKQLKEEKAMLESQIKNTDSTVNVLLETFNEVDANLALIKQKEGMITADGEMSIDKRKQIIKDIQAINTLMEENKKKIETLQADLKKSGKNVKQFEKKLNLLQAEFDQKTKDLDSLKTTLTAKDFEIAGLSSKVDTLHTQVASQIAIIQQRDTFIHQLDTELNTSYVAEGTYKELKEMGVIENDGWTPWAGKKVALNEDLSKARFMAIDKRQTTSIPLNAKKATLVSDHPEGSYEFQKTEDGLVASLEIKDPYEFWSISRYLVVEVK